MPVNCGAMTEMQIDVKMLQKEKMSENSCVICAPTLNDRWPVKATRFGRSTLPVCREIAGFDGYFLRALFVHDM